VIDGKKVVAWTPYGREATVSILLQYLLREHERGIVDEYWLYLNTDPSQVGDLAYAYRLAKQYKGFIRLISRPAECPQLAPKQRNTGYAYRYMADPDTLFVRFDDDIVYVHRDAVERMCKAKVALPGTLAAFALMWNNAIISWYAQKLDIIPTSYGVVQSPFCMDPVGWGDGQFAVKIHRLLLDWIEQGTPERAYFYQNYPLAPRQQFSVSCHVIDGADFCELPTPGVLDYPEEEHWITVHRPPLVGKTNDIIGDALVSHYTFYPQGQVVRKTDILDRYRRIAEKETQ
jgi:hypothetical protein